MKDEEIREEIVRYGQKLLDEGLTSGTGGNISYSPPGEDFLYISPSGIPYHEIDPEEIPRVDYKGNPLDPNKAKPSSESPLHSMLQSSVDRVNAIVHTHSPYASVIATLGKEIPPIYYLIANIGDKVPLAKYATYGTEEFGQVALDTLGDRNGALLEKHGALAVGRDINAAYEAAGLIENLAKIYYRVLSTGVEVEPLGDDEIERLSEKFQNYGPETG